MVSLRNLLSFTGARDERSVALKPQEVGNVRNLRFGDGFHTQREAEVRAARKPGGGSGEEKERGVREKIFVFSLFVIRVNSGAAELHRYSIDFMPYSFTALDQ